MNTSLGTLSSERQCVPCEPGTFCAAGSVNATACARGRFNDMTRQRTCRQCSAGEYQDHEGHTSCKPCEMGSYCLKGASNPLGCESGSRIKNAETDVESSSTWRDCVCKEGFFDRNSSEAAVDCTGCPSGTDCSLSKGVTLTSLCVE